MNNLNKEVYVATSNTRGFLKTLFDYSFENISFKYEYNNVYEVPNKLRCFLAKAIKWPIFDYIGLFKVVRVSSNDDLLFSYNRFLKCSQPYVIYLENPSALVNYAWERPRHFLTKIKLNKCFNDHNLKAIICMSKACYNHFPDLYGDKYNSKIKQLYPLVLDDMSYTNEELEGNCNAEYIECLYISSVFNLKGGCDLIEVFKELSKRNVKIHLTCITKISTIREDQMKVIEGLDNIDLIEFNLSKEDLCEYYRTSSILLNPTRADSFSLVTLEALKFGCAILATDIYAIKEMVMDGVNGYLTQPMYQVWDKNGTMNKYYRRHYETTVNSGKVDITLVEWMILKLTYLADHREVLLNFCKQSLEMSRNESFSEKSIVKKWKGIIDDCVEGVK